MPKFLFCLRNVTYQSTRQSVDTYSEQKTKKRAKKALNRSPEKFRVNWPFGSAEEVQNSFPDSGCGSHLGILIKTSSAFFLYKSTQYSLPVFQATGLLVQEIKVNLQDGSHLGFLIEMILPRYKVSSQLAFWFQRRS